MSFKLEVETTIDVGPHLSHLLKRLFPKPPLGKRRIKFSRVVFKDGSIAKGDIMALVLTDVQKVTLSIAPVDAAGNPAPVDGVPEWSSSDPSILNVEPSSDGLSAIATAVGPLGTAQANVSADADLGSGVVTITGVLDVEVTASQATSLSITAGTPEPK